MNPARTSMDQVEHSLRQLLRRDRTVLLGYASASIVIVGFGEWAALHFGMLARHGSYPVLVRAVIYIIATTATWGLILRFNRRLVRALIKQHLREYDSILLAYDSALGLKHPYTAGHGRRVAIYAGQLAAGLGLSADDIAQVQQAALLHDVGKIGIPDAILNKPAVLTAEEFNQARRHAELGADVVANIPALARLAPAIRHHHENFDGSGYPLGLRGNDIPLAARIIAVADTLDAMTTERPYNQPMSLEAAATEIAHSAGINFDPRLAVLLTDDYFLNRLRQARIQGLNATAAILGQDSTMPPDRCADAAGEVSE